MASTWPELHSGTNFNYVWDTGTLQWVKETQPGGSGGGAVTIADGADVAEGTTTDVAWVAGAGTVISLLKKIASAGGSAVSIADGSDVAEGATTDAAVITDTTGTVSGKLRGLVKWAFERMPASLGQKAMAASLPVVVASDQSAVPVSGTFFQATQPVSIAGTVAISAAALPLPAGAATEATLLTRTKPADQQHVIIDSSASIAVTGPLTDAQLRATAVPVSGTISTKTDLTPSSPTTTSVGVASAQAVAAAATRMGLELRNLSTARISLGFGSAAVLDSGITLYPGDAFYMDEYSLDRGAVNAIASAAASSLAIQEYLT